MNSKSAILISLGGVSHVLVNPFVKKGRAKDVLAIGGRRIWHLHLHETFQLEQSPDHRAPMHPEGIIEWGEVFAGLKAIDYQGVFLFEGGRGEEPEEWTRLTAEFPKNFAARYGRGATTSACPTCP